MGRARSDSNKVTLQMYAGTERYFISSLSALELLQNRTAFAE